MKLLPLLAVVALSGCSAMGPVIDKARIAYDEAAKSCEFTTCEGLSTAAVMRNYPAGTPRGDGWWAYCKEHYKSATPPWLVDGKPRPDAQ